MATITTYVGEQAGPTLTTLLHKLSDCLLLHGHTLCNIIKQGKLVVSCVCVCVCLHVFFSA